MKNTEILIYIFSLYSILFLYKTKTRNEFLMILMLFLALLQMGPFPNCIIAIITSPIHIRPMDIALILLLVLSLNKKFSKVSFTPLAFRNSLLTLFFAVVGFYTIVGVLNHGYAGIAEFRMVFFYIIILLFISTNVKQEELMPLTKGISTYLMPLILLVPLNLILTGNFEITVKNRQFGAFTYETVTIAFLAGYLYNQYYDRTFKLPIYLLPVYIIAFPYCSHRTVWAIIFATFPILMYWAKQKKYLLYAIFVGLVVVLVIQVDPAFFENRLTAFTNIEEDQTGRWRIYIWQAVLSQATFFGKGLGARWVVMADVIGEEAMHGAHNGYIQILYYLGYLGVAVLILLCAYFLLHSYARINQINIQEKIIYRLSFLSTVALALYMFGYGPDILSWVFIGFGLKLTYYRKIKGFSVGTKLSQNFHRHPVIQ